MKQTTFQLPEIRGADNTIITEGTYGKESPLVNSDNTGVLDYINNNLMYLYNNINGSRIYVANKDALPATGDLSAMYIAEDTGKWYLWDGTKYIETDNARKIADEALAARDAAKASQTAAKSSETAANTSEQNAANSKTAAETSASDAASSASDATTQANTAKAWATATTSPDGAADTDSTTGKTQSAKSWALYSKDRATASASSASAASTSASNAKASETNAANSKTAAETSADNAATSATAAANSAKAAANSARVNQADWNQTDDTQTDFIKNKPDVLLKSGGTVTGTIAATAFSGPLSGDVTGNVTGTSDKANADGNGNNIANTYVTRSALASSVTTATGNVATLTVTDSTLTNLTVTGETSVPTANAGNSSKAIANTEFVAKSLAALVDSAPDQLNTLNELATALGNDANFAATITAELAKKLNSAEAADTYATKTEAGVPYQIKRNTAYKVGDVLTSPSLPPGCVIVVTQAGTTGSTEPDWTTIKSNMGGVITDNTVTFYINDTLSKHSVGDIVYKPKTKTGGHEYLLPLDGQTIDGTAYKRLVDYLGTNVLPNLNGRYLRADTTPGTMVGAGLPNITGKITSTDQPEVLTISDVFKSEGALWVSDMTDNVMGGYQNTGSGCRSINLDASHSSAIYGKSDTVTPLTYTVRAYICYA
ncbi:MAG: hypothetical protein LKE88_05030 [Acidaminococcus provencensis]|jgi:hypothetical protein|uniref:hypothetical protein n=1 Tax=Acidaminococcus provencensis TaxID=2058289 RepID=UPI0023EFBC61|nr:hypothetical protein [Acidaminococcus provencensis]MCH4095989.1 hypothetical protein [Acidaminococcus provencensis]